jgi:G:T-mismatch repair DNA endonuclease (very short patch repair protein)
MPKTRTRVRTKRTKTRSATKVYSLRVKIKANRKRKASSLEKIVYKILQEEEIPFTREKTVGVCHADIFLAPKTLIELNGCYYHGCTQCFPELSKAQKGFVAKDARRYYFFKKLGFDLHVIWEHEVKDNPDKIRKLLRTLHEKAGELA